MAFPSSISVLAALLVAISCYPLELLLVDVCNNPRSNNVEYNYELPPGSTEFYVHRHDQMKFDLIIFTDILGSVDAFFEQVYSERLDHEYKYNGGEEGRITVGDRENNSPTHQFIVLEDYYGYLTLVNNTVQNCIIHLKFSNIEFCYNEATPGKNCNADSVEVLKYKYGEIHGNRPDSDGDDTIYIIDQRSITDSNIKHVFDAKPSHLIMPDFDEKYLEIEVGIFHCEAALTGSKTQMTNSVYFYDDIIDDYVDEELLFNIIHFDNIGKNDVVFVAVYVLEGIEFTLDYIFEPGIGLFGKFQGEADESNTVTMSSNGQQMYQYYEFKSGLRSLNITITDLDISNDTEIIIYESGCGGENSKWINFDVSGAQLLREWNGNPIPVNFEDTSSCQYIKFVSTTGAFNESMTFTFKYTYGTPITVLSIVTVFCVAVVIAVILMFLTGKGIIFKNGLCCCRETKTGKDNPLSLASQIKKTKKTKANVEKKKKKSTKTKVNKKKTGGNTRGNRLEIDLGSSDSKIQDE